MTTNSYTCIQLSITRSEYQYTTIKDRFFHLETIDPYIQQINHAKMKFFYKNP